MNVNTESKTRCRRVAADIRLHLVPIVVAVLASEVLHRLGIIPTVIFVIACVAMAAWRFGWRVNFTAYQAKNTEEESHGTEHHDPAQ